MLLSRSVKTANFLQLNRDRPFVWGDWDCNLFIVDLLDHIDAQGMPWRSQAIRGKYDTRLGACRFQYHYTPAPQWLEQQGYALIKSDRLVEHDIVLEPKKRFWTASVFFGQRLWSVVEDQRLNCVEIEPGEHTIARINYG